MRKHLLLFSMISLSLGLSAQQITWYYSTPAAQWVKGPKITAASSDQPADIVIDPSQKAQQIEGFGACFNELGWEALQSLKPENRKKVLNDLFSPEGANFNLCRMPLGSNDYSFSYYSYNDVPEDFEMKNFNIDRDRYILIPYIKEAMKIQPGLQIWASPWTPPIWMKVNNHYAMGANTTVKRMDPGKQIRNDATGFRMEDAYLQAYARYFSRFVQAYSAEGINVSRVMVQNEIVYHPHWQSCTWRPEDIAFFIGNYLGPQFQQDKIQTEIWLGTVNTSNPNYTRTVLADKGAKKYIQGLGYQWDAKYCIGTLNKEYPDVNKMQTESECGNGENNWQSAEYTWSLINNYLSNGVRSYMYWNMVLDSTGNSTWGWKQNMLIGIAKNSGKVTYNPEYYLMKHLSHFVQRNSFRLSCQNPDFLSFVNPNGEIVVLYVNKEEKDRTIGIQLGENRFNLTIKAKSFNTLTYKK